MDPEHVQAIAARDQLWSSLRQLLPDIEKIANGEFDGGERQAEIVQLIARIVMAELQFQADDSKHAP
jgi:hypothetical protein